MNGRLDGPAKYFYPSGAIETRIYENGVLQGNFLSMQIVGILLQTFVISGKAVRQTPDGECEDRAYVDGRLEGRATVIYPDSSKEIRNYQVFFSIINSELPCGNLMVPKILKKGNRLIGPATLFASNGHRVEFNYEDGVAQGEAVISGAQGDREQFKYGKGVKQGPATYLWKQGHREDFRYSDGRKTGASTLVGASGATRRGHRENGEWHGRATFTASDGQSKDEMWEHGRKI